MLADGTVLENARVLYKAPVPNADQVEVILNECAELSKQIVGQVSHEWSQRPETMVNSRLFKVYKLEEVIYVEYYILVRKRY